MILCIPTIDTLGRDAQLSGHFGSAPFFAVVDLERGTETFIPNGNDHHAHGTCSPIDAIRQTGATAVLVRGMGMRAILALNSAGIPVYRTEGTTMGEAMNEFTSGTLSELNANEGCQGHHA